MKTKIGFVFLGMVLLGLATPVSAQTVVSRAEWGAKSGITSRMVKHNIREIVIHHTGVKQQKKYTLKQKLRGLQGYSQGKKNWGDVPYHFYIDMHGEIGEGRELKYSGDTNTGYNPANRIHVVLEGHFDSEVPGNGQVSAMAALVSNLQERYSIPGSKISGHMDQVSTDCPGKNVLPLVRRLAAGQAVELASSYVAPCTGAYVDDQCFSMGDIYSMAQTHLQLHNCYQGAIDGDWGPMSRASLQAYNQANGSSHSLDTETNRKLLLAHFGTSGANYCLN